jgi:signal transduction histidine kinase
MLRRAALVTFAASVAMSIAAIALNAGIGDRPGLSANYSPLDVELIAVGVVVVSVALLLCWARPRNSVGWLLALSGVFGATCNLGQVYGTRAIVGPGAGLPLGTYALAVSAPLWIPALLIPGTLLLARYPSGHIAGRWARRVDRAFIAGLAGLLVVYATSDNAVSDNVTGHANPLHLPAAAVVTIAVPSAGLAMAGLVGIVVGAIMRMLRAGYPERQQLAWLFTTALLAAAVVMFTPVQALGTAAYATVPIAIAIGVLRYRLLGLNVVVRRTLVYGTLTGLVLGVFVAVTAGLTELVPSGPFPRLVAASIVAIGVVPARDRLQRAVDRLIYGDRRDPLTALQRLGTPMGTATGEVVPAVLAAVASALRAPGAAVLAAEPGGVAASYGEVAGNLARVPLRYAGTDLGVLAVAPRAGETALGKADTRLLDTLAPLVAVVVHAERLTADLRSARTRLLTATAAERSRLQHDMHDGLGPSLTGIGLGLEALQPRVDDARASAVIARLRAEVGAALEEVRRIIDDLRPAIFDDVDLITALRRRCEQLTSSGTLIVDLATPETLPLLSPEQETAIYRIADEALTNVVRHASASHCDVKLEADDDGLHLLVADNGIGFADAAAASAGGRCGVGLVSMHRRAELLGGSVVIEHDTPGTTLTVRLPNALSPVSP